jgi:hypothetical protein
MANISSPPLFPDICPCDHDLFPKLKENMRGIRYDDLDELEVAMVEQVRAYERGCLATGIEDLPNSWTSVVDHKGYYYWIIIR